MTSRRRKMSQFSESTQSALDYNSTIIGALELSEKKWVSDAGRSRADGPWTRGRHPKPSYEGRKVNHLFGLGELRFVRQGELPANLVSGGIL